MSHEVWTCGWLAGQPGDGGGHAIDAETHAPPSHENEARHCGRIESPYVQVTFSSEQLSPTVGAVEGQAGDLRMPPPVPGPDEADPPVEADAPVDADAWLDVVPAPVPTLLDPAPVPVPSEEVSTMVPPQATASATSGRDASKVR